LISIGRRTKMWGMLDDFVRETPLVDGALRHAG
jgi:hypothetical protein